MNDSPQKQADRAFWRSDNRRIARLTVPKGGDTPPTIRQILSVSTDDFQAQALWERRANVWHCVSADPVIKWMLPLSKDRAALALLKMEAKWSWSNPPLSVGPANARDQRSVGPLIGRSEAGDTRDRNTTHEILSTHSLAGACAKG